MHCKRVRPGCFVATALSSSSDNWHTPHPFVGFRSLAAAYSQIAKYTNYYQSAHVTATDRKTYRRLLHFRRPMTRPHGRHLPRVRTIVAQTVAALVASPERRLRRRTVDTLLEIAAADDIRRLLLLLMLLLNGLLNGFECIRQRHIRPVLAICRHILGGARTAGRPVAAAIVNDNGRSETAAVLQRCAAREVRVLLLECGRCVALRQWGAGRGADGRCGGGGCRIVQRLVRLAECAVVAMIRNGGRRQGRIAFVQHRIR